MSDSRRDKRTKLKKIDHNEKDSQNNKTKRAKN